MASDLASVARAALAKAKAEKAEKAEDSDELAFEEERQYPGLEGLDQSPPALAVKGPSGWIYHSTSFGCLRPHSCLRRLAIWVIEHPLFDPFILLTIMCNCSTMAWTSPLDAANPELVWKMELLAKLEWVYLYIFTFELTVKMIGYGLVGHPYSYLRDAWCQLDFVVVTLAWLPIFFPAIFGNMSAIRSVRALRPLRALKRVPGMPVLVGSILQSLPALGSVVGLTAFFFVVFGIVGMNLFGGVGTPRLGSSQLLSSLFLSPESNSRAGGAPTSFTFHSGSLVVVDDSRTRTLPHLTRPLTPLALSPLLLQCELNTP